MKTREMVTDGYDNGARLARSWQEDGLILAPIGEVCEQYRLVHQPSVEALGDAQSMQGPEVSLLELLEDTARAGGSEEELERIGRWTDRDILEAVDQIHRERLEQNFSADRYPELRGLAQFEDAEAKGIADVVGTDYRRVLFCKDEYRRLIHVLVQGSAPADQGCCTTALFKDSPVGPIIGRNMDSGPGSLPGLQAYGEPVRFRLPEEMGISYLAGALCLNEAGLVVQGSSIAYPNEPTSARFWVSLQQLMVRFCRNVREALDLIDRYCELSGPTNLLILDAEGESVAVEKSHTDYALRRTDSPWLFATDGIAVEPATAALQGSNVAEGPHEADEGATVAPRASATAYAFHRHRFHRLVQLLERESSNPGFDAMGRVMRDHDETSPICKHGDRMPSHYPLATLYSFVLAPQIGEYDFWVTRPGPAYPCESEPTRYAYSFSDEC